MRFWGRGSVAVLGVCALAIAGGAWAQKTAANKATAKRANELTLAGLRPGRDRLQRAKKLYGTSSVATAIGTEGVSFTGNCTGQLLRVDADRSGTIQQIILAGGQKPGNPTEAITTCAEYQISWPYEGLNIAQVEFKWRTGHNVALGANMEELTRIYGQPDSRSPSTKDGQPLELWYYAFDWAGADVPQVMEVLCTREADGKPGRVVEITLAGPSL
jgi:hypothetical protein